jgi:hypothetical protein
MANQPVKLGSGQVERDTPRRLEGRRGRVSVGVVGRRAASKGPMAGTVFAGPAHRSRRLMRRQRWRTAFGAPLHGPHRVRLLHHLSVMRPVGGDIPVVAFEFFGRQSLFESGLLLLGQEIIRQRDDLGLPGGVLLFHR